MALKSWLVGLPPTDTHWEQEDASFHRSNSTPDLASEAGTTRIAPGTVNTRSHSASPRRQPTLEWKRRLVDGNVGYGDQTSLFGPSGLENMFARPQTADCSVQQQTKKTKKNEKKTRDSPAACSPPPPTYHHDGQEQGNSPRESTSSRSSAESEMLASLCEGMDLVAMRTATIKKALADLIDSQKNGNITTTTNNNNKTTGQLEEERLHATPAAADNAADRSTNDTNLENISPVVVAKRTTIDGKVSYNAYSPKKARAAIIQERKGIDKTDTSQRAREIALAMGDNTSAASGADDGSFMNGARHISGFTDAPEVESDKPNHQPTKKNPESWDFTDPPMSESSELAAAARDRGTRSPLRFGTHRLESSTFDLAIPPQQEDESEPESMEDFDGTLGDLTGLSEIDNLSTHSDKRIIDTKEAHDARLIMLAVRHEVAKKMKRQTTKHQITQHQTPRVTVTRASGCRRTKLEVSVDKRAQSPITSPTPKRRRTLHGSEIKVDSIKSVLFHDMPNSPKLPKHVQTQPTPLSPRPTSRKRDNALAGEAPKAAAPAVLEQRKIARQRNVTPSMGPSTGDWLQECKRVIGASRANELGGIQEANEEDEEEHEAHQEEKDFNTKKSDNMKTLAPQEVAHLLGGEVKGMTFDKDKNRWVRTKSAEHRFLNPKDALSSDDDPFRDISDLTAEKSVRSGRVPTRNKSNHGATTVIMNHEAHVDLAELLTSSSSPPAHVGAGRTDTPQQDETFAYDNSKLPGEESTLAHWDDEHTSDPEALGFSSLSLDQNTRPGIDDDELVGYEEVHTSDLEALNDQTIDLSTSAKRSVERPVPDQINVPRRSRANMHPEQLPARPCGGAVGPPAAATISTVPSIGSEVVFPVPPEHRVPTEIRTIHVSNLTKAPNTPNANISNTFMLSDLPDFTVHQEDHERPSERALAARLAKYAQLEAADPFALTRKELVKAITDIHGQALHWEDITTLRLASKGLTSIHGLDEHCGRVESLDISHNALTQVVGAPPFVRQLNATFNQITSLTSWASLMHLQYLDLSNNDLDSLDGLSHLIHLRELRVDNNRITNLEGIIELDGLITFSAKHNKIQAVDLEHFKLDRLNELDLSHNNITSFDGLEALPCLRKLCLDSNPLGETMRVSDELQALKHLSLRSCGLSSLSVDCFPNLRSLYVDHNKLHNIDGLPQLKQLNVLSMVGQKLAPGVHIRILDEYIDVEKIIVSDNELPRLNLKAICMSVKHLEASNTGLQELPKDFGLRLPNLRTLDLSYNGIKDIRPLASLSRLEHLQLLGCSIHSLRRTVGTLGSMSGLTSVDMRENPLTYGFYERRDAETAMSKRTYEILVGLACEDLGVLDGREFCGGNVDSDLVMEKLVELGIVRPSA